jgi:hypothetical protein
MRCYVNKCPNEPRERPLLIDGQEMYFCSEHHKFYSKSVWRGKHKENTEWPSDWCGDEHEFDLDLGNGGYLKGHCPAAE